MPPRGLEGGWDRGGEWEGRFFCLMGIKIKHTDVVIWQTMKQVFGHYKLEFKYTHPCGRAYARKHRKGFIIYRHILFFELKLLER